MARLPWLSAGVAMILVICWCELSVYAEVSHAPKQERVFDFGSLIPPQAVDDTQAVGPVLERVTTAIPWGRGMANVDGELIVLSRGRHRGEGGVDQSLVDDAGTLWRVDTSVSEPVIPGQWAGEAVRHNATVFARPTTPPFHLYGYEDPPQQDTLMGRPYCALVYDPASQNIYICCYSGAELPDGFRKHATDAVYRYDLRDAAWHIVEQHNPAGVPREALGAVISNQYYPHHDPDQNPPPHGWLNGPDGCAAVGDFLYVPAKDNHVVVQYDLNDIRRDPAAPPPDSRPVLGANVTLRHPGGERDVELLGPSAVTVHGKHLYVAYRTSSVVIRFQLDHAGDLVREDNGRATGDLIAVFEPWDANSKRSGNLYDIAMSASGDLFVSMGTEGKVWRLTPDPSRPFYGNDRSDRRTSAPPFIHMTELVGRKTGCNNIYIDRDNGYLYVSSRNNDTGQGLIHGTIYRVKLDS